jgi:type 1 fimbrial protein
VESINEIEGIYMKLRFISSALAAALFAATGSYAAVVDGGTIHFEGELVNAACS